MSEMGKIGYLWVKNQHLNFSLIFPLGFFKNYTQWQALLSGFLFLILKKNLHWWKWVIFRPKTEHFEVSTRSFLQVLLKFNLMAGIKM